MQQIGGKPLLPFLELTASLTEHPLADGNDQSHIFCRRDEVERRNETALRMLPADQGLEPAQLFRLQINDRLIMNHKLLALDGAPQVGLHLQEIEGAGVQGLVKDLVPRFAERFGAIHRRVSITQGLIRLLIANGTEGDADAG